MKNLEKKSYVMCKKNLSINDLHVLEFRTIYDFWDWGEGRRSNYNNNAYNS